MKLLSPSIVGLVMKPKQSLKDLVLGSTANSEAEVLAALEANDTVEVSTSATVDMFLVSLDLSAVFKIEADFLYSVQDSEDFRFLMLPENATDKVSDLINFLAAYGVGSVIEIHNVIGMKRYTIEDIRKNVLEVVRFSGYVKHFRHELASNYPLPIVSEAPFNTKVVYKEGYFVLELPSKALTLSQHLDYYNSIKFSSIEPTSLDHAGYHQYSTDDFQFIVGLVLAHNFNCRRIAEVFNLPYQAFKGYLSTQYRYKENNIYALNYKDIKHDVDIVASYLNSNFFYNPFNLVNVA